MAGNEVENLCEQPTKSWIYYSESALRSYILRNINKTDCSFVIKDPNRKKPDKVVESFKWILCDISPVLKDILNDETNRAKNCKSIPVFDPNFEAVLIFAYTKHIDDRLFDNLLVLLESAMKYEICALRYSIYERFERKRNFTSLNWTNFFRIKNMDKTLGWCEFNSIFYKTILPKMTAHDMERELELESNIEMILDFDDDTFDELFCIITERALNAHLCFRVTEAYLIKNIFNEKIPSPPEEQV